MDTYTKGVLTVIAVVLVSISFQLSNTNVIENAKAMSGCGGYSDPCYVQTKSAGGESVNF